VVQAGFVTTPKPPFFLFNVQTARELFTSSTTLVPFDRSSIRVLWRRYPTVHAALFLPERAYLAARLSVGANIARVFEISTLMGPAVLYRRE
jgi:hypothetical protein